jgi:hypothetical protein
MSSGFGARACVISATTNGCEIVWPQSIASARSSYAWRRSLDAMNRSRGIPAMASSTRSSVTP